MTRTTIDIKKVARYYEATVTKRRWLRNPRIRIYISNGGGSAWSCPDASYGVAGFELAARLNAALLRFFTTEMVDIAAREEASK